ncbi:MAG TPA: DUF2752 domain-containing protein [Verrucomicrobiae bacterium]|nr:DUF2752 domain-containing protein [Verrucomicrobiae bacterium]
MIAPAKPQPKIKTAAQSPLIIFAGIVFGSVILGASVMLYFFNPGTHHFFPTCTFHQLTGFYCPGCGATRATYQLLHGNLLNALHDNALYVLVLFMVALRGIWFLKRKMCNQPIGFFIPPLALWIFLAAALIFAVLRNLPAFSFLAP